MAHIMKNLDILLVSAKKDPVVLAHMHTTNKETAGYELQKEKFKSEG